jgi:CRP-like cAMP-binding protein
MMVHDPQLSLAKLELVSTGLGSREEIASMLDNTQMFRGMEWFQIEALSSYVQLYRAVPGSTLFREGDKGDFMCIVLKGKLEVRKEDNQHIDKTVATIFSGRSLGEMSMVDGEPRSATVVVVEPTLLAVLTREDFQLITNDKPALAAKILLKIAQLLSQHLRHTSGILVDYLGK